MLNCPRIQCQDHTKHNYDNTETDTMAARGCKTYTCATQNPELGIFQTGKQQHRKTCLEVEIFIIIFLYAEHLHIKICPKIIRINWCELYKRVNVYFTCVDFRLSRTSFFRVCMCVACQYVCGLLKCSECFILTST